MRASGSMQDRVLEHNNVDIHYRTAVNDVVGDAKGVTGLKIKDTESGQRPPEYRTCLPQVVHCPK